LTARTDKMSVTWLFGSSHHG